MSFLSFLSSVSISVSCCSWLFSGFVYSCVPYTYTFEIFIYGLDWRCLSFMYFFHVVHDSFLDSFIHVYYYTLLRFSYVVNLIVMDIFRLYLIMNLVTSSFFFFFSSVFFFFFFEGCMGEGGGVNDLDLINLCFFFNGWKQIFLLGRKLYVDTQVVTFDGLFLYVYIC